MARTKGIVAARNALDREVTRVQREVTVAQRALDSKVEEQSRLVQARDLLNAPARTVRAKAPVTQKAPARGKQRAKGLATKAERVIRANGKATAADVTKALKANSGSVQYALRVLEERGTIKQTGKVIGRTREYEFVGAGKVSEPGS